MIGGNRKFHTALSLLSIFAIASLMLMPVEDLVLADTGMPPLVIRALSLINPTMLMIAALTAGYFLAPKVGLDAPFLRSWAQGRADFAVLQRQFGPSLTGAILVGGSLLLYGSLFVPQLEAAAKPEAAALLEFGFPAATRLLYGGIGEEIIMRWGLMSLIAWAGWKLVGKTASPSSSIMWIAIAISALLFGVGHLPVAFAIIDSPPALIIAAIIIFNGFAATIFGWLFWKYGLEAAIGAHIGAHIIGLVAGT
jgi:hypothetical protein